MDVTNLLLDSPPLSEYVPSGEYKQLHSNSHEIMLIRSFGYTYRQRHRFLQVALLNLFDVTCKWNHNTALNPFLNGTKRDDIDSGRYM